MSFYPGINRSEFWSAPDNDIFRMFPRLNRMMARDRFEEILRCFNLTDEKAPPATKRDPFWQIRPFQKAWNSHNREHFDSCWLSCMDESMNVDTNPFNPGHIHLT
jgi:hypothetical protein